MSSDEEQQRLLVDAAKVVREQAFYMKREIDADNLPGVVKHATEMLKEMKSNSMEPRTYNDLYMKITDELRELEEYFMSLQRSGRSIVQIYEMVQNCGNIVPRIYMMICVGGVYISSMEAPAKDILTDLIEMVKGVQHPMRGLFLRNYLAQVTKNRLPDVNTVYIGAGGSVMDAIQFILQNFVESTRLWVRLQNQGSGKDRKQRERERLELRILVGTNLVRLSQLEGLDVETYKAVVLPKVLEEIVSSKDKIAQYYLMDCIIQVFPDESHLNTLDLFLDTCPLLKEKVNVRSILESLMDRLAQYSANNGHSTIQLETSAFKALNDCVSGLIETRANMSLTEVLHLQTSLINFALKCYPSRIDYVSHCLAICGALIDKSDSFAAEIKAGSDADARSSHETCTQVHSYYIRGIFTWDWFVLLVCVYFYV
jgi:vacuolar protein sorting-associated protein 35